MKIFMAALATETNTFSPFVTTLSHFKQGTWFRNDASRHPPILGSEPLLVWRRRGEADGHEVVESLCTYAEAGGVTLRETYEELRDTILKDLRSAMPVDAVLLFLHGAMVADGYDDCEGDTLSHVRAVVGSDATIGVELDLHCHLTETMRTQSNVLVAFKEYPHVDISERAHELYDICMAAACGRVRPVIAYHDCRMVNLWPTSSDPMKSFVAKMKCLEGTGGILSVSFAHGFPWGDVVDNGAKIMVVADGGAPEAATVARQLGQEVWAMRFATALHHDSVDEALDVGLRAGEYGHPVVLADVADNAGGGAPSDNTTILRRLADRCVTGVAIGSFWDPVAVSFCFDAGIGGRMMLRIGGKCGASSGAPVDLMVTVRHLARNYISPRLAGSSSLYGDTAWVEAGGIDIVLNTHRNQVYAPEFFTGLGIPLEEKRIIVVKSTQHFHAAFAPVAKEVRYVSAPGALMPNFASIPYAKRSLCYWPRVADPFKCGM